MNEPHTQSGFTLIEVMIALVIAAIALTALSKGLGQFVLQQTALQERVHASWVAQNRLYEVQLQQATGTSLEKRSHEKLLGQTWTTEFTTRDTVFPQIRQIEVDAWPAPANPSNDRPTIRLYSVLGKASQ
ncbi:MAG: type II secretion system minor pseudopilin GspI [Hydrogenovibrio sp.]|nr:type II secretion system minor pseudopilin GspI [Hydrogenovibrio sp.]